MFPSGKRSKRCVDTAGLAMSQNLKFRKTLIKIINELEKEDFKSKSITTINGVLDYYTINDKPDIVATLKTILFERGLSDGITYFKNVEIPLDIVLRDLKSRSIGDCSTINVTRIPYRLDELIRCFIIFPEQRKELAKQFKLSIKSEAHLAEAMNRLSLESKQSNVECGLSNVTLERVFKKETLDKIHEILIHYVHLLTYLDNSKSYEQRLTYVTEYLIKQQPMEGDDIETLLSMLANEIHPKSGFFQTLFGENQKKLFKSFRHQLDSELTELGYRKFRVWV